MQDSVGNTASGGASSISTSLLQRVQAQDPEAWRRLVALLGPEVYLWCRQSGLQAEDATDVVQEVFSAVAAHVAEFRREQPGDSFRGWLWTIARNKIRDHFRRLQGQAQAKGGSEAQERLAQIPDHPPPSSPTSSQPDRSGSVTRRTLELVRAEFEDRTWQAFWRTTVDRQPAAAVAEELGMSPAAVYQAKSRVLRRVRQELEGLEER